MRIVVFSGLLPPQHLGGYEIGTALVVEELKRRGHELLLLSARDCFFQEADGYRYVSHTGDGPTILPTGLCVFGSLGRLLRTQPVRFVLQAAASLLARRRYRKAVAAFRPACVLLFNPCGVAAPVLHDLAELAHEAGAPIHAYVADAWLADWPAANPVLRVLSRRCSFGHPAIQFIWKGVAAAVEWVGWAPSGPPRLDRVFYCSEFVRRLGLSQKWGTVANEIVPWGLANIEKLPAPTAGHFRGEAPLTVLFAGRIGEGKGLDVLLRALAGCRAAHHLVVLGDDTGPRAQTCKNLAAELNMAQRVHFLSRQTHGEMLARLGKLGHVLVVPATGNEPFGRIVLEGMALGLPVVASDGGGSAEVMRHGDTGFLFARGAAAELTAILDHLEEDRELCGRVGVRARRSVLQRFTIERMVDRLLGAAPVVSERLRAA